MKGKTIKLLIVVLALFACNDSSDQTSVKTDKNPVKIDSTVTITSFYMDESEISSNEYKQYYGCGFDEFLKSDKIPTLAKDIYNTIPWSIEKDDELLKLLDSLDTDDKEARPFYFKVLTISAKKSDGYYAEALGLAGKEYIENQTREFASYFDSSKCFTDNDLETWVEIVFGEFLISEEEGFKKSVIDNYLITLKWNCRFCTQGQKKTVEKFGLLLQDKWIYFRENVEN